MFSKLALGTVAALVSAAALPSVAQATVPSQMTCNSPHGPRGAVVTYTTRLTVCGQPYAGQTIRFYDSSDRRGLTPRGSAVTDCNGYARLVYVIPTNPLEDNVYLYGKFAGNCNVSPSGASVRVRIGY